MKKAAKIVSVIVLMFVFIMSLAMISTAEIKKISYKSIIPYNTNTYKLPLSFSSETSKYISNLRRKSDKYRNSYLVIDNYDLCKELGISGKSKNFFKDNLLIINKIYNPYVVHTDYKNTGVEIKDNVLNVYYTFTSGPRYAQAVTYVVDIIELKKSDVKGVDLTKEVVNIKEGNIMSQTHDVEYKDYSKEMKYINLEKLIKNPEKVTKVKLKSPKKKQLKVTWKKIKGAKYQVQYSLKKNMKKAKLKNSKKNKIVLKKLKSNKKYYVRVRAYKTVNGKKYFGKWSNKAAKMVK